MSKEEKNNNEQWSEEESGSYVKFEQIGDSISGLLLDSQEKQTAKGSALEYTILTSEGTKTFFASKNIRDKLASALLKNDFGNIVVKITYSETIRTNGGNDFKIFQVLSRKRTKESMADVGLSENADSEGEF